MEKKVDALIAPDVTTLVKYMRRESIQKDDIVQIMCDNIGQFIVIFYS